MAALTVLGASSFALVRPTCRPHSFLPLRTQHCVPHTFLAWRARHCALMHEENEGAQAVPGLSVDELIQGLSVDELMQAVAAERGGALDNDAEMRAAFEALKSEDLCFQFWKVHFFC